LIGGGLRDYKQVKDFVLTPLFKKLGYATAALVAGGYAYAALQGPQGLPSLIDKWEEVRRLEKENADLRRKIEEKRARLKALEGEAVEFEVRRELQHLKPGEKTLIIEAPPSTPSSAPEDER